jgi:hypothetical protein
VVGNSQKIGAPSYVQHIISFLGLGVPTSHVARVLARSPIVAQVHSFHKVLLWFPVD